MMSSTPRSLPRATARAAASLAAIAGMVLLAAVVQSPGQAQAADVVKPRSIASEARSHVTGVMARAVEVLAETDAATRTEGLRALVEDSLDLASAGRYALGPAWRRTSAASREDFLAAFQVHVVALLASQRALLTRNSGLAGTSGTHRLFSVGRVRPSMYGMTVDSRLETGPETSVRIGWRLVRKPTPGGGHEIKIIDLTLNGTSLALQQRVALAGILAANKGKLAGTILAIKDGATRAKETPAALASRVESGPVESGGAEGALAEETTQAAGTTQD